MLYIFLFADESDRGKFEYIYQKYNRLLLSKAHSVLRDYSLAEDAVSEAFIRVYKNLRKIDDPDSPRTIAYLVIITRNAAITMLNKQSAQSAADIDDISYDFASPENIEEAVTDRAITEEMLAIVDTLKEEWRAPFLLMYAYSMSHKEIALQLGISENNVTVRIHRAKKRLAELFADKYPDLRR